MTDIFISYGRSVAAQAQRVAEALRALDYNVWRDDELPAHRAYAEVIEERLRAAKAVVVIWSTEGVKSQWVRAEADLARQAGTLVQLSIDGAMPPLPFNQIQCADMKGWTGDPDAPGWRKVLASVSALAGSAGAQRRPEADLRSRATEPQAPAEPLLAVLAFENLSGDAEMDYFSDGVSQEILDTVARSAGLKVIARASSFQLRGGDKAPQRVAASLKATHILDGSVRKSGPRVRISAELVECATGGGLWSDRFDRELSDVFALQDEIAGAVAEALKSVFAPASRPPGVIAPEAYELYLQSRNTPPGVTTQDRLTIAERAVALAPDMAAAWGWVAHLRVKYAVFERGEAPFAPLRNKALEAVHRALDLDPAMGLPRIALSQLQPFAAYARREALIDEALTATTSDSVALMEKSVLLSTVGRYADALPPTQLAATLDPAMASAVGRCGILQLFQGHWREGQAILDGQRARWPGYGVNLAAPGAAHEGNWAKLDELAGHVAEHGVRGALGTTSLMFAQAVRNGDEGFANLVQAVVEAEITRLGAASIEKLYVLSTMGRTDLAYDMVDRSSYAAMFEPGTFYMAGGHNIDFLCSMSHNRPMIEDPRFVGLCAKLGLTSYWASTGRWPDCVDQVPYDFRAEAMRLAGGWTPG